MAFANAAIPPATISVNCFAFLFGSFVWNMEIELGAVFVQVFFCAQQTLSLPPCLFVVLAICLCIIHCGVAIIV